MGSASKPKIELQMGSASNSKIELFFCGDLEITGGSGSLDQDEMYLIESVLSNQSINQSFDPEFLYLAVKPRVPASAKHGRVQSLLAIETDFNPMGIQETKKNLKI